MKCQHCFEEVPENAKVCGYCGTKIDKNALYPCPSCGEGVPVTAKVCGYCGMKLVNKDAEETPEKKPEKAAKPIETPVKEAAGKPLKQKQEEKKAPTAKAKRAAKPAKPISSWKKPPKWILYAGVGLIVALAVAAYFLIFGGMGSQETALIYFECDEEVVPAGQDIVIYYHWSAKEAEQVDAFFDATEHFVSVNDVWYKIQRDGLDEIRYDKEEDNYARRYWMNIGSIKEPGWYRVNTVVEINEKVFDGWGWSGPGTANPRIDLVCNVQIVE